jgi:uncharacterized membrane protein
MVVAVSDKSVYLPDIALCCTCTPYSVVINNRGYQGGERQLALSSVRAKWSLVCTPGSYSVLRTSTGIQIELGTA